MKKVFIKSYGCQMNHYDSERMLESLTPLAFQQTESVEEADMIILNTCHIREKAADKLFSDLGRLNQLKNRRQQQGQQTVLTVAGCVAQAEGEEIQKRAPYVDIVIGPQAYHRLPQILETPAHQNADEKISAFGVVDTEFPVESKFDHLPKNRSKTNVSAFLTIQEGCDKFCTFCVVPYTRGAESSRPVSDIVKEAQQLVRNGAQEIILLGQNVNAYHGISEKNAESWGLARLLYELAEISGLRRLRYTTSHPLDMGDDLIKAHGEIDILMPYLHLPVQSGSNRILKLMNRRHNTNDYERVINQLRFVRPDIALSSDFIVGFPGETDHDFKETLAFVNKIGYAQAFSFKYSARPGTPAATHDQQVDEVVKDHRLQELQALLDQQQHDFNQKMVGQIVPVLFEKTSRYDHQIQGRSPYMQLVHVIATNELIGHIRNVRVDLAHPHSLVGTLQPVSSRYTG